MCNCLFISFLGITFLATVASTQQVVYSQPQVQPQPHVQPPSSQTRAQSNNPQQQYQQPRTQVRPPHQVLTPQQTFRYVSPTNIPVQPAQSPSPYMSGHHKIIDPSNNQVVYHHYYNYDNNSRHEVRSWYNPEQGQATQPIVERALLHPYETPISKPAPQGLVYRSPLQPSPPTNGYYHQFNRQQLNQRSVGQQDYRRSLEKSNEYSSPLISRQSVPTWLDNIETLVSYIKSSTFRNQVGSLGSQIFFRSHVVGDKLKEDDKLIRHNNEKSGLNFTLNQDDCKPKLTTIKLGNPDQPDIIYNPSSVEVLRCPQACFSWQFDCIPTQIVTSNFTVAAYFTNGETKIRKVDQFTMDSHVACGCSCQSLAGCFGNTKFSPQRLPPTR